jgi:hypothetical protein
LDFVDHTNRSKISRFCLSSQKLEIEIARQANFSNRATPTEKLCKYCPLKVCEDEFHFLIECDLYKDLRKILYEYIRQKFDFIDSMSSQVLYIWLMCNKDKCVILSLKDYFSQSDCTICRLNFCD